MRIRKRTLKLIFIALFILIIGYFIINYFIYKNPYQFNGDKLYYSENRGQTKYEISLLNSTGGLDIFSVNFFSKNFLQYETKIYGLLFMQKGKKEVPGLVLLPGGGVSKESESRLASIIAESGYAVLTFDQRGIGETDGYYLGFDQDFQIFSEGKEPIQHLSVYDGLKAFDVLKEVKNVDKNNIAIAGESMGARYAIIAAAIEKRLKGVIVISSAGFHVKKESSMANSYLLSIDPDHYISDISPRFVFMLHGTNDTKVSLNDTKFTFNLGKEPKRFFAAEGCGHGYCDKMEEELREDLRTLFGK